MSICLLWKRSIENILIYSSLSPMRHKASMSTLHCIGSLEACWASPHDRFICSSSCVTVLHHVVLGLPRFFFCQVVSILRRLLRCGPAPSSTHILAISGVCGQSPWWCSGSLFSCTIGDLIRPKELASITEHFHSPHVCFDNSPALWTVQQNRLYIAVI